MHITLNELPMIAETLVRQCVDEKRNVIALHGDLGAGKTSLVAAVAAVLGVREVVVSPTFIIYRTYQCERFFSSLIHIDAYRLETPEDADRLRVRELFAMQSTLVCCEWPELVAGYLPANALHVYVTYTGEYEREVAWS